LILLLNNIIIKKKMDSLSNRILQLRHAVRANRAYVDLPYASSVIYSTSTTSVSNTGTPKLTRLASFLNLLQREGYISS
jgi:ribosomal protein S8